MKQFAVMATYPGRAEQMPRAVASLLDQVDQLAVVLNEYEDVPPILLGEEKLRPLIPSRNTWDVGKFCVRPPEDGLVFLVDDDIVYPPDYCDGLTRAHEALAPTQTIVGVHGVIYPEYWDGAVQSRLVMTFNKALEKSMFVNQLGTGTVAFHSSLYPHLEEMASAARFVDVRFAKLAYERGVPMVCIRRPAGWLKQIDVQESVYTTFTAKSDPVVLQEVLSFGGVSKLPVDQSALRAADEAMSAIGT
jgi:hypothetical protein